MRRNARGAIMKFREIIIFGGALLLMFASFIPAAAYDSTETDNLPVRFAILGDRTGGHLPGIYIQVVEEIQRMRPDFVMTVGDQIEGYHDNVGRLNAEWDEYKKLIAPLTMPIHFTPGNHDILSDVQEEVYRSQIGEPYYSFEYCGVHIVVLNNGRWESSEELPAEQINWLINNLDTFRNAKYTLAFMHKPFWYNTTAAGKPDTLHSIFRNFGVDAVFTGHFHQYFVGEYDGIKYTSLGSSGAEIEDGPTGLSYHFGWVTVDESGINITPIEYQSVMPWKELTADELLVINKMNRSGLSFEPLTIGEQLQPVNGRVTLTIHNYIAGIELEDTLRWEIPEGWTVTPEAIPVKVSPDGVQSAEFQASYRGALYPVPTAKLPFSFAEGKSTTINAPLRVARTITCNRASMPPMVDGNIAEPIWKNPEREFFAADGGAMNIDPVDFYFSYDEDYLYVSARCTETVMDSMAASVVDHDGPIYAEDCIGLFLQPDMGKEIAYQIYFNPLGRAFDQKLVKNEHGYMDADRGWDGQYDVKAIHGADFWIVEAAIPLSQFGTKGRAGKKMGLNFRRKQARLGASADWQVPIDYNPNSFGILIMK